MASNLKGWSASDNAARQNPKALSLMRQRSRSTTKTSNNVSVTTIKGIRGFSNRPTDRIIRFVDLTHGKLVWSKEEDEFPRFKDGTVYIELVDGSSKYSYALNIDVLAQSSPWFNKELRHRVPEGDKKKAIAFKRKTSYNQRFELSFREDGDIWVLIRVPLTTNVQIDPLSSMERSGTTPEPTSNGAGQVLNQLRNGTLTGLNESSVEGNENTEENSSTAAKETEQQASTDLSSIPNNKGFEALTLEYEVPVAVCEAYNNLFLLMNGEVANLDSYNVDTARDQIEQIVKLANYYGCLNLVLCPSLSNHLIRFGNALYKAVMFDAPRYLKLSIYLESATIFREAMVHATGHFLDFPWKTYPGPKFPAHIFKLISTKSDEVRSLKTSVDIELLTGGTDAYGRSLTLMDSSIRRWIVTHHWRDWVRLSITKDDESYHGGVCTEAAVYRKLEKGGDSYLPTYTVLHYVQSIEDIGAWNIKDVENDLQMMKAFGKRAVSKLCVNNSKLDIEECNIQYLTCCEIEDEDLPWMENGLLKPTDEKWPVRGLRPPTQ